MPFDAPIPVLRMLSVEQARAFYVDYLGFRWDWERRAGDGDVAYAQVSRGALRLQLSCHPGDAAPGATVLVGVADLDALLAELNAKDYSTVQAALLAVQGRPELVVTDPFGNRLRFAERTQAAAAPVAPTPLTRAQVRAAYIQARAEGTLPPTGEVG